MTKETEDIKIKYLYTEFFNEKDVNEEELHVPKKGEIFKAFYSPNGASPYILPEGIVIDVNNKMPMTDGMMIMDLDGDDAYSFKEITPENIENFDLDDDKLNTIAQWMMDEDKYINAFVDPFVKIEDGLESLFNGEDEIWKDKERTVSPKLAEIEKVDPNIAEGLTSYIDDLHLSHMKNQKDDTGPFMMEAYQKILNDGQLGNGANIASMFSSLMGYMQTGQERLLKNLIYHALTEFNRKNKTK